MNHVSHPSIAYSDGRFLVLWEDTRDHGLNGPELYAASVDVNGGFTGPQRVTTSVNEQGNHDPTIVARNDEFALVWECSRYGHHTEVRFARMSLQRQLLMEPVALRGPFYNATYPAIATTATGYRVAWASTDAINEFTNKYTISHATFSFTGELREQGTLFEGRKESDAPRGLALVSAHNDAVFVWTVGWTNLFFANDAGSLRQLPLPTRGDRVYRFAATRSETELALVWEGEDRSREASAPPDVLGFGTLSTREGSWRSAPRYFSRGAAPSITWDGTHWSSAWYDRANQPSKTNVYVGRIRTNGELVQTPTLVGSRGNRSGGSATAVGAGQVAVAWIREQNNRTEVLLSRFSLQGERLGEDVVVSHSSR